MRDKEAARAVEQMKRRSANSMAYNKANTVLVTARLNYSTDADLLEWLESQPNKSGLIKELLREKMQQETGEHL